MKKTAPRTGISAIVLGEYPHTEYTISIPAFRALDPDPDTLGVCYARNVDVTAAIDTALAKCDKNPNAPTCAPATRRSLHTLRRNIVKETAVLNKKKHAGAIPVCLVASRKDVPFLSTVYAHERFHARWARRRTVSGGDRATLHVCETHLMRALLTKYIGAKHATHLGRVWGTKRTPEHYEEVFARIEELQHACTGKKRKVACDTRSAAFARTLVNAKFPDPNVIASLATAMSMGNITPDFIAKTAHTACMDAQKARAAIPVAKAKKKTKIIQGTFKVSKKPWKPTKKDVCEAACVKSCAKPKKKGAKKRCADAPKKLSKACATEAFSANMRHSICVGKKPQNQAKAIAYSVLRKGCGTAKTFKGTPKEIVANAKRKRR